MFIEIFRISGGIYIPHLDSSSNYVLSLILLKISFIELNFTGVK